MRTVITISINKELLARAKEKAKKGYTTFSGYLAKLIMEDLKKGN